MTRIDETQERGPRWGTFSSGTTQVLTVAVDDAVSFSAALSREPRMREFAQKATGLVFDTETDAHPALMLSLEPQLMQRFLAGRLQITLRTEDERHEAKARELARNHTRSPAERAALALALGLKPRIATSPKFSPWASPPIGCNDLPDGRPAAQQTPGSAMAPFVGPRIGADELGRANDSFEDTADRILAWPVAALEGHVFVSPDLASLPAAFCGVLQDRLGGLPFAPKERPGFGGPGTYFHAHTSLTAPPEGDVPMAVELYAKILALGDLEVGSIEFGRWLRPRRAQPRETWNDDLPGPLTLLIETATYANVRYPSVNIPEYW